MNQPIGCKLKNMKPKSLNKNNSTQLRYIYA